MVSPEVPTLDTLKAELAVVENRLELADEIENPIERYCTREALWEQRDELQAEIEETDLPLEHP